MRPVKWEPLQNPIFTNHFTEKTMQTATLRQSSFAALFDPAVARAAAERAAQWNLPRHTCRPLDRYTGARVNAALASYDAEVDGAAAPEDDLPEKLVAACGIAEKSEDDDL
jgi:hypothetical protein